MAISPQQLTIYLYSAHRAVIFAIAQLSCCILCCFVSSLIVFRASVSAGFPALKSCLTPIIVSSNKLDLIFMLITDEVATRKPIIRHQKIFGFSREAWVRNLDLKIIER